MAFRQKKKNYFPTAINSTMKISIQLFWQIFFPKLIYCWMSFLYHNHYLPVSIRVYQNISGGCIRHEQHKILNWLEVFVQYSFTKFYFLSFHLPHFNLQKNKGHLNYNSLSHSFPPYHRLQFILSIPFHLISI